jgi:hypothetical protein
MINLDNISSKPRNLYEEKKDRAHIKN